MARNYHKPEEIVGKLRQVEVLTGQGKPVADAVRAIEAPTPVPHTINLREAAGNVGEVYRLVIE
jgi:hypothetical protein